jgi:ribonuclease PH
MTDTQAPFARPDGRAIDQLRPITFETGIAPHALGSVLVSFEKTRVICAASIDERVPGWMRAQKVPALFETETLLKSDLWSLERIISSFLLRAP